MENCLFCKIVRKEIPARFIYEDETAVAFADIHPQAPHHYLLIPKNHATNLNDFDGAAPLLSLAAKVARQQGLEAGGWRLVVNNGAGAGQTVFHLHLHLLAGRPLQWPPG